MTKSVIGFIGQGLMGHGMAENILKKGNPLVVMAHRRRAAVDAGENRGRLLFGCLVRWASRGARAHVELRCLYFGGGGLYRFFQKTREVAYVMRLVELEDRLRLHIPEIDSQHEQLIDLVNGLHEGLIGGADRAVRDGLLSQLLEGMRSHCAYEEGLMLRYDYPGYQAHKSEHDRLSQNLVDLIRRYRNGELVLSIAVVMEFKCWATIHIEKSDKPLGVFLNDRKGV